MRCSVKELRNMRNHGRCIHKIYKEGCNPGDFINFVVYKILSEKSDRYGFPFDVILKVECNNCVDRYMRLRGGIKTLKKYLLTYMLIDTNHCVYSIENKRSDASKTVWMVELLDRCKMYAFNVPDQSFDMGIPQKSMRSGICWYGSLWYALLTPKYIRNILRKTLSDDE
jgi:hypothetical protein